MDAPAPARTEVRQDQGDNRQHPDYPRKSPGAERQVCAESVCRARRGAGCSPVEHERGRIPAAHVVGHGQQRPVLVHGEEFRDHKPGKHRRGAGHPRGDTRFQRCAELHQRPDVGRTAPARHAVHRLSGGRRQPVCANRHPESLYRRRGPGDESRLQIR